MSVTIKTEEAFMMASSWWPLVSRGLSRDLDVHVLAANAGAGLVDDGPCDWPPLDTPAGWAAWYAAGDELP